MGDHPDYRPDLRRAYDADAERRGTIELADWRADLIDAFAADLRSQRRTSLLELGCGTGQAAERFIDHGLDVVAVDLSPSNVALTRARGVNALVGDFGDLPFHDNAYEAAFAMNALLHVPPEKLTGVLAEISRVLEPEALFRIVVWGGRDHQGPMEDEWLDPPRYYSTYTDDALLSIDTPRFRHAAFSTVTDQETKTGLYPQILTLIAM